LLFVFASFNSEKIIAENSVTVQQNQFQFVKGNVIIDFTIHINGRKFYKKSQWIFTPVMQTPGGQMKIFPSVIVNGKLREKLYQRSLSLNGRDHDENIYAILTIDHSLENNEANYHIELPFEPWMNKASLSLWEDRCGCHTLASLADWAGKSKTGDKIRKNEKIADWFGEYERPLAAHLKVPEQTPWTYTFSPVIQWVIPEKELVKKRDESGEAYLIFKTGNWDILPDLANNKAELHKIEQSLEYIKGEPTAIITSCFITAYSSPEGSTESNMKLSQNRAEALRNFVKQKFDIPDNILSAEGMGEAWDELISMVEADTKIENKARVLRIMRTVSIKDGRKKQLMNLSGKRPYNYMREHLFPRLRRVNYKIEYTIPSFTVERGKELLKTKPGMLSLEELYTIANTYEKGSEAYNQVFNTAVNLYPQNPIANVNAAAVALLGNNYTVATSYLKKYPNETITWNNLAVVYMHEMKFDEAEKYLKKAQNEGVLEAGRNLIVLEDLREADAAYRAMNVDYELYKKIMNGK
jgi:tetratricopeptide (TPR) repeat protein